MKILTKMTPFRMIGNIYFVGTKEASSHLIDTGAGLILIDSGYEESAEGVVESISELGFDIKDVKYILHSHGHYDHTDATPALLRLAPDAKTFLSFKDIRYIRGFTPDFDIREGDVIKLGNTEIHCMFTPGHTEGSVSFFIDVTEDGKVYRAAMFGGSGANQLKKDYMNRRRVPYLDRGLFYDSVERLLGEHVDVMIGNHTWQNHTAEKYAKMGESETNPFINPKEWGVYLRSLERSLTRIIKEESRTRFVNYAHRGASEYYPENTFSSFDAGLEMGASGIETDVRKTKDGVLVLFHDSTLERVCGKPGSISDYTYAELEHFSCKKGEREDKIVKLEDFLMRYGELEITLAIELKDAGIEREVVDLIKKYSLESKTVVTSFNIDYLRALKEYDPLMHAGYLTRETDEGTIELMKSIGIDEYCPVGREVTPERVEAWHRIGFNVRAWGISSEDIMKQVYDAGADGMTVNYPEKLAAYIAEKNESLEEQST